MSKELTPLEALEKLYFGWCDKQKQAHKLMKTIETALKDYEMERTLRVRLENINYELVREKQESNKKLKVLEIIKEKQVNVFIFLHSGEDLDTYNDMVEENRKLTQQEFDLLKEWLK